MPNPPAHPEVDQDDLDPLAFIAWLQEHPRGALGRELAQALADCVQATQLYDKVSTFGLTVKIGPGNQHLGDLQVQATVASKPAKPTDAILTFFPTPAGGLSRRDPLQPSLPGVNAG